MVYHCTCDHKDQDKLHGKKMRVFNRVTAKTNEYKGRCTVCGNVVNVPIDLYKKG